jgi:hypothetical protein
MHARRRDLWLFLTNCRIASWGRTCRSIPDHVLRPWLHAHMPSCRKRSTHLCRSPRSRSRRSYRTAWHPWRSAGSTARRAWHPLPSLGTASADRPFAPFSRNRDTLAGFGSVVIARSAPAARGSSHLAQGMAPPGPRLTWRVEGGSLVFACSPAVVNLESLAPMPGER